MKTVMFTPEFVYKYSIGNEGQTVNRDSFVRKFDQHTKVVKRVVEYYHANKEKCNFNQRTYMKNRIVDGILFAQYTICILWEPNMEKGYANAKEFDAYLKTADKELYNSFGEKYLGIAQLRELDFNPNVYGRIPDLNFNIDAAINPPRDTRSLPRKAASRVKRAIVSRKN